MYNIILTNLICIMDGYCIWNMNSIYYRSIMNVAYVYEVLIQMFTMKEKQSSYQGMHMNFLGELKHPCRHDAQNDSEVRKNTHTFSIKKLISHQPFIRFYSFEV